MFNFFFISFPNFVSGLGFPSFQNPKARAVIILYILSPNEILLSCNTLIVLLKYITLAVNILWTNSSALTSLELSALDSQLVDLQFVFRTHVIVLPFCICCVENSSFCNVWYNFGWWIFQFHHRHHKFWVQSVHGCGLDVVCRLILHVMPKLIIGFFLLVTLGHVNCRVVLPWDSWRVFFPDILWYCVVFMSMLTNMDTKLF